jgi:hypothetical protein
MKYAAEMVSFAVIYTYIPTFINIESGIQKLTRGDSQGHRQLGDLISLLLFCKKKESSLKS